MLLNFKIITNKPWQIYGVQIKLCKLIFFISFKTFSLWFLWNIWLIFRDRNFSHCTSMMSPNVIRNIVRNFTLNPIRIYEQCVTMRQQLITTVIFYITSSSKKEIKWPNHREELITLFYLEELYIHDWGQSKDL